MNSIVRAIRRVVRPPLPQTFLSTGFPILDLDVQLDEERNPFYSPTNFYPARIGEVLHARYQIVGKLGYGGYSTVWLCRDLIDHEYVTLKLCRSDAPRIQREIDAYKHLNTVKSKHAGSKLVRTMLDHFNLEAKGKTFPCIIHKPLGLSLRKLRTKMSQDKLPENVLKLTVIHILIALDFLYTAPNGRLWYYLDIQEKNVLLGIEDASILDDFEKQEHENPVARKIDGDRIIYQTRPLDNTKGPGRPVLTDFGEGRLGSGAHTGLIQPLQYRAPEVLLEIPWDEKVDIWNVGVMIWDLFEDENLFSVRNEKKPSVPHHLAHMIALLGPPPADFLKRSSITKKYFNEDGSWNGLADIPQSSLESSELNLEGDNKALFLEFVRKMLKWKPEERFSAHDLLRGPWLRDGEQFAGGLDSAIRLQRETALL